MSVPAILIEHAEVVESLELAHDGLVVFLEPALPLFVLALLVREEAVRSHTFISAGAC